MKAGRLNKFSHVRALINLIVALEMKDISNLSAIYKQSERNKKVRWPLHVVIIEWLWSLSSFYLETFYPLEIILLATDF